MDKNQTEIFGEFSYPESMTYEELLSNEEFLKEQLDIIFLDAGAEHLDFTPLGDMLMLQCAFECRNLEILRDIAQEVAELLPDGVRGRILCLEKNLTLYHMFWLGAGEWQEMEYKIPRKGPAGAPVNRVDRIRVQTDSEDSQD